MTRQQNGALTSIQPASSRLMNRHMTALNSVEKRMLRLERKGLLGVAIHTHLAIAGAKGMDQIITEFSQGFAEDACTLAEINAATKGMEYHPYVHKYNDSLLNLKLQADETFADIAGGAIADIIGRPVLVEERPKSWLQRLVGGEDDFG